MGIRLCDTPDVYILIDARGCQLYSADAHRAHIAGTRCVTLRRKPESLRERNIDWFDEFIDEGTGGFTRSGYGQFRYSGPLCVQYACLHGAKRVVLVGCDGYKGVKDYYDGSELTKVPPREPTYVFEHRTMGVLVPAFRNLAEVWPDVEFIQYGDPCFSVDSSNWTVIREW